MSQAQETGRSWVDTVVIGLFRDIRRLVRQEIALARHEVEYETGKILKAVFWFGIAAVLAVVGLFLTAATCALILFEYTGLPAWACAAIVSLLLLGGAWGLVAAGSGMVKSVRIVPVRTIRTLVDDVRWIAALFRKQYT